MDDETRRLMTSNQAMLDDIFSRMSREPDRRSTIAERIAELRNEICRARRDGTREAGG